MSQGCCNTKFCVSAPSGLAILAATSLVICGIAVLSTNYDYSVCEQQRAINRRLQPWTTTPMPGWPWLDDEDGYYTQEEYEDDVEDATDLVAQFLALPWIICGLLIGLGSAFGVLSGLKGTGEGGALKCFYTSSIVVNTIGIIIGSIVAYFALIFVTIFSSAMFDNEAVDSFCDHEDMPGQPGMVVYGGYMHDTVCREGAEWLCKIEEGVHAAFYILIFVLVGSIWSCSCACAACCCCPQNFGPKPEVPAVVGTAVGTVVGAPAVVVAPAVQMAQPVVGQPVVGNPVEEPS